jgi:hypothetical protein
MEPKGVENDCGIPLNYYGGAFEHAAAASDLLDGAFIEFVNGGVAQVWAD